MAVPISSLKEILDVAKIDGELGWWIILECGHWVKWNNELPPKVGILFKCPNSHDCK